MKIKNKIITLLILTLMSFSVMGIDDDSEYLNGNPYFVDLDRNGFLGTFTVVDGLVCSEKPDGTAEGVSPDNEQCLRNTKDFPVIYTVWTLDEAVGREVGEVTVRPGERKCIGVEAGKRYHRAWYYCNQEQVTCEETIPFYSAGCDFDKCGEGEVLRIRELKEKTSGGCSGWNTEACIGDDGSGFDCVKGDKEVDVKGGESGSESEGVSDKVLKGEWLNIGFPPVVCPECDVIVNAQFKALEDGKYYLEAGIDPTRTFTVTADKSLCDGSLNFAGAFVNMKKDEIIDVKFTPDAPDKEGNFNLGLGAYTGCLNAGGEKVNTVSFPIKVTSTPEKETTIISSVGTGILAGSSFLIIGGIIVVILIIAGVILMTKK